MSGVPVAIRYNFLEPRGVRKGELKTMKTGPNGTAVFTDIHLEHGGFSVTAGSMHLGPVGLEPVFFLPDQVPPKFLNPTYTRLPADVTIVIHRRSLKEEMQLIFPGP